MSTFEDSTVIVTGASSGIGRASALRFGAEGANVVVADVDVEGAEETVGLIREADGEASFVETDVSDPDAASAMVDYAVETYGGLDYAHNNAGIEGETAPTADQAVGNFSRVVAINLGGVFNCMRAELPVLVEHGGGVIVNTTSIAGVVGFPNSAPYVASKHGVIGLTKTAALEYSGQGVRVNAVAPGVIDTAMVDRAKADQPDLIDQICAATPIGRIGRPDEIGDAVVWLCSDDASFVTGETLVIDGGYVTQ